MSDVAARQKWMAVLARACREQLDDCWETLADKPEMAYLRRPEIGLVMVQGRAGGDGDRFNLGEMTVTRCAVRLAEGRQVVEGHGYVIGRDKRHADLAARFDALLQVTERRDSLLADVIAPLAERQQARRMGIARKAAATKVDFFTMVRGHS